MRERLTEIIGPTAARISVATFHSFGIKLVEEFFLILGLEKPPQLLTDMDKVSLYDDLLENRDWKRLRKRSGGEHSFADLKSLISLLKREQISPEDFTKQVVEEIRQLENDPGSLSSRGQTKGELKSEISTKLEALDRTREAADFYRLYEETKKERNLFDYDDVLENIVTLVQGSEEVRATLEERYLYVLVDEHQDSSGAQNEFLAAAWAGVEKPNLFVVGDDRQLIYGFGGASLSHFEKFTETFLGTKIIALTENYRSTQTILNVAEKLLSSTLVPGGLCGSFAAKFPVELIEAEYPRDEIIAAGLEIKRKLIDGVPASECAILVPKQAQARTAVMILKDLGLPVVYGGKISLFALPETQSFIRLLRVLASPAEGHLLAPLLLDHVFGVSPLTAHKFLKKSGKKLTWDDLKKGEETILALSQFLEKMAGEISSRDVYSFIQVVATESFLKTSLSDERSHRQLLTNIEMIRTMLHLALAQMEKNPHLLLADFVNFLDRMADYGEDIPLAVFSGDQGVEVMTLHGSKGREFDFVWIAHLDENSLMKGKRSGIALPEKLKEKALAKDEATARRELYVAITRAKRFCRISYARSGYSGTDQALAKIVAELPTDLLIRKKAAETEREILATDPLVYISSVPAIISEDVRKEIVDLVRAEFAERPVSVTHLNNFFSCPWKWYFRSFLQLPEPTTESLKFGNVVHGVIEKIISGRIAAVTEIAPAVEAELDELHIWNERERQRLQRDAQTVLNRFHQERIDDFCGASAEERITPRCDPDFGLIEVDGQIDAVKELPDGTLLVADFKTGRVKKKGEIEKKTGEGRLSDMLRQLTMYSYLLGFDLRRPKVSRSQLIFLEAEKGDKDGLYETTITTEEISLLRKDLTDYVSLLESGQWLDRPCDFKPFGQQKECPYCALWRSVKK